MKEQIESVFEALKELEMKPTPKNVSIMNGVYNRLKGIYKELEEKENAANRRTADPDGRNNH